MTTKGRVITRPFFVLWGTSPSTKGKTMFYATHDSDGGTIKLNADIRAFETRKHAEAWLRRAYGSEWDPASITIEEGNWSDAWIKTMSPPESAEKWMWPFDLDELRVQRPGSHPGGRAWWITPYAEVLIVTDARELD